MHHQCAQSFHQARPLSSFVWIDGRYVYPVVGVPIASPCCSGRSCFIERSKPAPPAGCVSKAKTCLWWMFRHPPILRRDVSLHPLLVAHTYLLLLLLLYLSRCDVSNRYYYVCMYRGDGLRRIFGWAVCCTTSPIILLRLVVDRRRIREGRRMNQRTTH